MASPRKKWVRAWLKEQAEKEAQEATVQVATVQEVQPEVQAAPVVKEIADVVIAPNNTDSTKPKKARPIKSSRRRTKTPKKTTKE